MTVQKGEKYIFGSNENSLNISGILNSENEETNESNNKKGEETNFVRNFNCRKGTEMDIEENGVNETFTGFNTNEFERNKENEISFNQRTTKETTTDDSMYCKKKNLIVFK